MKKANSAIEVVKIETHPVVFEDFRCSAALVTLRLVEHGAAFAQKEVVAAIKKALSAVNVSPITEGEDQ
jgi:hypothetical protein